jgi:hypothetical protein
MSTNKLNLHERHLKTLLKTITWMKLKVGKYKENGCIKVELLSQNLRFKQKKIHE